MTNKLEVTSYKVEGVTHFSEKRVSGFYRETETEWADTLMAACVWVSTHATKVTQSYDPGLVSTITFTLTPQLAKTKDS